MNICIFSSGFARAVLLAFACAACALACSPDAGMEDPGGKPPSGGVYTPGSSPGKAEAQAGMPAAVSMPEDMGGSLERIAEIERAGAFFPGLALAESGIRELAGDFAGASIAAYKELAWAYACGSATKSQVEEGLQNALALFADAASSVDAAPSVEPERRLASAALRGCAAFVREDWALAEKFLSELPAGDEEPDSFLRWMLCVCALEGDDLAPGEKAHARSAYGAIRARYGLFPEYWYRGARAFAGADGNIAAAYAEQCVNTSARGPFSGECRKILAARNGVASGDGFPESGGGRDIRTKAEIENIIRSSVSVNNPKILEELFPLIALPDNPYTLYALGAMKSLNAVPDFRNFFAEEARKSAGRLGERLNYISRG